MPTEIIKIAGDEHEVPIAPLTLIVPDASMVAERIEYPCRVDIDLEGALFHLEHVQKFDTKSARFVRQVFELGEDVEVTPDSVRRMGLGARHFGGRIDLTLKLMQLEVPIAWKYPEAGLHPRAQLALADVLLELSK